MIPEQQAAWEKWLSTRPVIVQELARKYPPGTKLRDHAGKTLFVVSYEEDGGLGVSSIDPAENYAVSIAVRQRVCNCCMAKLDSLVGP
jgi:hypothetical protein